MSSFKLEDYETVKERKARFYQKYPDGRIIPELITSPEHPETVVFRAYGYTHLEDNRPFAGYAHEWKGPEKQFNTISWFENCEESAIGRMLDNAGFSGNGKCSCEEMLKVQKHETGNKEKKKSGAKVKDNIINDEIIIDGVEVSFPDQPEKSSPASDKAPAKADTDSAVDIPEVQDEAFLSAPAEAKAKVDADPGQKKKPVTSKPIRPAEESQWNKITYLAKELGKSEEETLRILKYASDWFKANWMIGKLEKQIKEKSAEKSVSNSDDPENLEEKVHNGKPVRNGHKASKLGAGAVAFLSTLLLKS